MKTAESEEVEDLLRYEDDTAGGIMVPDFIALKEDVTAKEAIESLLGQAVQKLIDDGVIESCPKLQVTRTKDAAHGDFTSNVAMMLAKQAGMPPRDIALLIIDALPADGSVVKIDIAGPGFINFRLTDNAYHALIPEILEQGHSYGRSDLGAGKRVQVEFVSANPTGPLHVGHGRGAAYGAVVADLYRFYD